MHRTATSDCHKKQLVLILRPRCFNFTTFCRGDLGNQYGVLYNSCLMGAQVGLEAWVRMADWFVGHEAIKFHGRP